MAIKYETLVTESLAKQIAENIREAIMAGRLEVDERLPTEEELAERFQVSRPTVREALKRLAAQNLIRSRRGPTGGTFVNRPSHEEVSAALANASTLMVSMGEFGLDDIAEARHQLETVCCRLAAERREAKHLEAMAAEIALQGDPALTDADFCASDVRFHRALVNASGNAVLQFLMYAVIEALQPVANMVVFRFRERETIAGHHRRIFAALEARDAGAAVAALTEQIDYLREKYAEARAWRRRRDGGG